MSYIHDQKSSSRIFQAHIQFELIEKDVLFVKTPHMRDKVRFKTHLPLAEKRMSGKREKKKFRSIVLLFRCTVIFSVLDHDDIVGVHKVFLHDLSLKMHGRSSSCSSLLQGQMHLESRIQQR